MQIIWKALVEICVVLHVFSIDGKSAEQKIK